MSKVRIPLRQATVLAEKLISILAPTCDRIEVKGSIARCRETVGDIEILCVPRIDIVPDPANLFGGDMPVNREYDFVTSLRGDLLLDRLDENGRGCFGPLWQRVTFRGFGADIFCCTEAQWGVSSAIRTGPAEFSKRLASPKPWGFLPMGMKLDSWRLVDRMVPAETREEIDFFNAIGLDWIPAEERI